MDGHETWEWTDHRKNYDKKLKIESDDPNEEAQKESDYLNSALNDDHNDDAVNIGGVGT